MKYTDWIFANGTKLYLLPLKITDKLYQDNSFESFKYIFNEKVDRYEEMHAKFKKKVTKKRTSEEQEVLF
jgi:hypothetical protein